VDWSTDNYNRQNKKSAPTVNKKTQKYNKGGFTHPVGEVGPASEERSKRPVKQVRENARWKVPIRLTLIWGSISDQYIGLVSKLI
jgi:hypothetical protein